MKKTRITSLAAALVLGASTAHAQAMATFGSAELAGFGEGSALLGTSLSTGHQGWGPIATLIAQTYRYRNTTTTHAQAYALSPSVGLQYSMPTGAVQASVGYSFVSTDENTPAAGIISGNELGGKNSAFVSAQVNHWGTGEHGVQWIGNYAFESEYYWTRLRLNQRFVAAPHPIYLGVEGVLQGTQKTQVVGTGSAAFTTKTQTRFQAGPTIEYRVTNDFRVGASAGVRSGTNNYPTTGYARIEFLALNRW